MIPSRLRPLYNLARARPVLAVFEITLKCNSACGYCHLPLNQGRPELGRAEIKDIFTRLRADGVAHILIQASEPLIRPDCLDILEDLGDLGLTLTLVTNGTALSAKTVGRLARLPVSIAVSLDTLDPATYRRIRGADQLGAVLKGIDRLGDFPGRRFLTCIVSRQNMDQVTDVLRFARARGFLPVLGAYHWQAAGFGKPDAGLIYGSAEAARLFAEVLAGGLIPAGYLRDYALETLSWLKGEKLAACDAGRRSVVIDAAGNLAPCLGLPPAGNLRTQTLSQILTDLDRRAIKDCSDRSTCNLLCARVIGGALRRPIAGLRLARAA